MGNVMQLKGGLIPEQLDHYRDNTGGFIIVKKKGEGNHTHLK